MPAHPAAFAHLAARLRRTRDPALRDQLLDIWIDIRDRATEWDARRWGFEDPDTWARRIIADHNEGRPA
ncbi:MULTISPECIES: hypothetical protein [Streptomyces]|uniref:Uncharacterized protein n=1 Tax=Streptomyces muensis TaxID=1077944 RepID=A0A9X1Q368_STRM4|nr:MULTISPECIES: hypothetical protein [Streptomyces]MCF1597721.1 hypothetical protein [Streptomyces muensis]QKV98283.1 hypothetical protein HUT19_41950 [Streptomyces sp. NA02950]